jgi:hypothetical protein
MQGWNTMFPLKFTRISPLETWIFLLYDQLILHKVWQLFQKYVSLLKSVKTSYFSHVQKISESPPYKIEISFSSIIGFLD